jgi:hypothetical protein
VRSITLQDAVPNGKSSSTDPTTYLAQAFDRYVALCQADAVCAQAFPNLPGTYEALWQHYRNAPTLVQGDDGANHRHEVLIDGDRLPQAIYSVLRNPEIYPLLATGVLHAGDALIANRLIDNNLLALDRDAPWGTYFAGQCSYQRFTVDPGSELSKRTRPAFSGIDDRGLPSAHGRPLGTRRP